jgi:hypothetical protein
MAMFCTWRHTQSMTFTVIFDDSGTSEDFGDDESYNFDNHGHLVTHRADGTYRVYSSRAWVYVQEKRNPEDVGGVFT